MNHIHWQQGAFLQPHHLQRLQKNLSDRTDHGQTLSQPYPYGILEFRLAARLLDEHTLHLDSLRAILPSGLYVDLAENAVIEDRDIRKEFATSASDITVYLAVPRWQERGRNQVPRDTPPGAALRMRYRVESREISDENTGDNPKPVQTRRLNALLLLEGEDPAGLELLPLLRITRSVADEDAGRPRLDHEFVPPCLTLNASARLRDLVRDLGIQVTKVRDELALQLDKARANPTQNPGGILDQVLRLRTLNVFSSRLPSLVRAGTVHPFQIHLELLSLLGELTALSPDRGDHRVADYDHDNPHPALVELNTKIRHHLRGAVKTSQPLRVPFVAGEHGLEAQLKEEHFTRPDAYYLGVRTRWEASALSRLVEDPQQFKLQPLSYARRKIDVRGVVLRYEPYPPAELPAQPGLHFYKLVTDGNDRWDTIRKEDRAAVVKWSSGEQTDFDITLFMTVPEEV